MRKDEVEDKSLLEFVSTLSGGDVLRVEESLGSGFVRLRVAEAERRQAKHDIQCVEDAVIEMLRNARDAGCYRIFVASSREGDMRSVLMVDDGAGIPQEMHDLIFDARVTTKLDTMRMDAWGVHGRGMALYSIRENATEARVLWSEVGTGSALEVTFDTKKTRERAEQSAWPSVQIEQGKRAVRGPRNIVRACVEFALESEDECRVYYGSPSEVVATMRALSRHDTSEHSSPIALFSFATSAREVKEKAEVLGFSLSERTAHRIASGQIRPVRHVLSGLVAQRGERRQSLEQDAPRRIAIGGEEAQAFASDLKKAFSAIESQYYVKLAGEPKIRSKAGSIVVEFPYMDDE